MKGRARKRTGSEVPLAEAYQLMRKHFGHQHWWPGESAFEVCVGAILTQNTAWSNVERVIRRLRGEGLLEPRALFGLAEEALAARLRPAGYYNVKARRLRAFLRVLVEDYHSDLERLFAGETRAVRARLLAISGVGPETADSMLLYAGRHASFVVDAYTKRIFLRHGWCGREADYDELQALCAGGLCGAPRERLDYWQDCHAQLVMVGKHFCRARQALCGGCPLRPLLRAAPVSPGAREKLARPRPG